MGKRKLLIGFLVMGVAMSAPFAAWAHKNGHESQKGGLPALEEVVDGIESEVSNLISAVTDLQGQNNWAVVAADGTVARSSSNLSSPPTVLHTADSGVYEVNFGKDVSKCVYEATVGDTGTAVPTQGQISVSGDVDGDSPNDVYVQTFDKTGATPTDSPFHLYVSCN
jgi:hypothetical protein